MIFVVFDLPGNDDFSDFFAVFALSGNDDFSDFLQFLLCHC